MPRGDGIYDEEHADKPDKADKAGQRPAGKEVPEDTPDVDTGEGTTQEPPD